MNSYDGLEKMKPKKICAFQYTACSMQFFRPELCALCFSSIFFCTRSRDRTGTASLPLVFETSASTYSAIRA